MKKSLIIAGNTFRQAIRDKILYGILVFALLFIGSTVVLSSLSLGEDLFVIRSFGLAGIYIFGLIITIFLGASILYNEVDQKTTYIILSKPITKNDLIVGKFTGLLMAIGMTIFLMLCPYLFIVILNGGSLDYMSFLVVLLQLFEMGILIAILILLSVFTTPLASIIYTIIILYSGHLLGLIKGYASHSGDFTKYSLMAIYYIFPNLEKFNIRNLVVHNQPIPANEVLLSMSYAIVYIVLALFMAQKLLNRKEL